MSPLLWALLACPAPTKPDTEPESCYSSEPSAAGGCPVFEDCATADLEEWAVVDVCGDGLDNDCDGVVDDSRCVDGCVMGSEEIGMDLATRLVVAPNDPALWVTTAEDPVEEDDRLLSFHRTGGTYSASMQWDWSDAGRRYLNVAIASIDGVATILNSNGELAQLDDGGGAPTVIANLGNLGVVDLFATDGVLSVMASNGSASGAIRLVNPGDGAMDDPEAAAAVYQSSGVVEESFGNYLLFLPDPGGDGIPEVVIGAPGTLDYWDTSALYIFDGADTGTLTPADAIAAFTDDRPDQVGLDLHRAGDLDGDGYEELISWGRVLFGPFDGTIAVAEFGDQAAGYAARAGASVNGDELPDLIIERHSEPFTVEVYLGPFEPAHYDEADADWIIDTTGRQYLLAQVDDDPEAELISADYNFGPTGDEGIVTFIDFACR